MIRVDGVSKFFERGRGAKQILRCLCGRGENRGRFCALKNVSLQVNDHESLSIIGANGAGKSTLLSLIAGLAQPDEGRIEVGGSMATLLELGSGFHPDLTGFENLKLNASLLGFTRRQVEDLCTQIVEFADIGDSLHEPTRTYSTGMVLRLAFSIAIHLDPSILIIDEVLAVGDAGFQSKCRERIRQFRQRGKTLLCVTHDHGAVLELCDKAIWLDHGEVMMYGKPGNVLAAYQERAGILQAGTSALVDLNTAPASAERAAAS